MVSDEIYSRCGNQCTHCLTYRVNVKKDDKRTELCTTWGKLGPHKYKPEEILCDGCFSDTKDCKSRKCVVGNGLEHCGHCPDYPCSNFPAESDAAKFYAELERQRIEWTDEDEKMMARYNPGKVIDEWRKNRNK